MGGYPSKGTPADRRLSENRDTDGTRVTSRSDRADNDRYYGNQGNTAWYDTYMPWVPRGD